MEFPSVQCPPTLKQVQHFLKLAQEHDARDIVIAYWSRLYALQVGLKINTKKPGETELLLAIMDWLERVKKENSTNDAIVNEVAAQAHLENYALKLFLYADKQDREGNFGKNVVKAFYSSGVLYDVLQTFGELSEEALENRKYAKWKAAYIHNCLKNGETPISGPQVDQHDDDDTGEQNDDNERTTATTPDEGANELINLNESQDIHSENNDNELSGPSTLPSATPTPTVEEILNNPDKLPSPPMEEEKPGGFEPFVPSAQPHPIYKPPTPVADVQLTSDQMMKAQKYCKYAGSALNYDDVKTAIDNLEKALRLLTTGQDDN